MLLQANDYLWLHDHMGCELQVGGSDQWGNILVRRRPDPPARRAAVHGLSLAPAHRGRRHEARQDHRRPVWLDRRAHVARTGSSSTGSTPTTPRSGRSWPQFTLLPVAEVDAIVAEHLARPERTTGAAPPGRRGHRARPRRGGGGGGRGRVVDPVRRADRRTRRRGARGGGRRGAGRTPCLDAALQRRASTSWTCWPRRAWADAVQERGPPSRSSRAAPTSTTSEADSPTVLRLEPTCCSIGGSCVSRGRRSHAVVAVDGGRDRARLRGGFRAERVDTPAATR